MGEPEFLTELKGKLTEEAQKMSGPKRYLLMEYITSKM